MRGSSTAGVGSLQLEYSVYVSIDVFYLEGFQGRSEGLDFSRQT